MITKIKTIIDATNTVTSTCDFVKCVGEKIIFYTNLEKKLNDQYFLDRSFDELKYENTKMYEELIGDNYNTCYSNPEFSVTVFGFELGQVLSAIYTEYRSFIKFAYEHNVDAIGRYSKLFIDMATVLSNEEAPYDMVLDIYKTFTHKYDFESSKEDLSRKMDPAVSYCNQIIPKEDLSDLRYLFKYGAYITDNEIKTAEFMNQYSKEDLTELMRITAAAYVNGFKVDGKDVTLRDNVRILFNIGQERMVESLIKSFESHNLVGFYADYSSTSANRQYGYDHRFDNALYLNEDYKNITIDANIELLSKTTDITLNYSGIMYFDKFGEAPFTPKSKDTNLKLSEKQTRLSQSISGLKRSKLDSYARGSETSFCIIAFPIPEIGENFKEIFEDICKINRLSSEEYLPIQQHIIDALDQAEYVHVKGSGTNKTDIKVMQNVLSDSDSETNYYNCGADVNIPVGEVFTSPMLKDTNGVLHLDVVYLNDLKFIDLELEFKDGYISKYSCKNFDDEDKNLKFIEENLLFPHKTLPLGEFAIGTNTLAYAIAEKHDIVDILPVLIVEKMGPHFAIGDTCFTYSEDINVFNPDGKNIIARDNERSILRKEDISKAYTNVHTDITLPYDSLAFIKSVNPNGDEIHIIKDGRFVLKGTEKLNEPFDQ